MGRETVHLGTVTVTGKEQEVLRSLWDVMALPNTGRRATVPSRYRTRLEDAGLVDLEGAAGRLTYRGALVVMALHATN
jgi:hypothetical protein